MTRRIEIPEDAEWLSVRDAARALGVHENTIRNWSDQGLLEMWVMPGSGFRKISAASVTELVEVREKNKRRGR